MPSVAYREWWSVPCGLLETIIEYRAFTAAYQVVSRAAKKADIPDTPMVRLVQECEFAIAQEELDRRKQAKPS